MGFINSCISLDLGLPLVRILFILQATKAMWEAKAWQGYNCMLSNGEQSVN